MMPETLRIGLDIGSTTIKCVVLDEADKIIYSCYERHLSLIAQKTRELLTRLDNEVVHGAPVRLSISGSAGMGLALGSHISFVQEVYATKVAADMLMPGTDVIIELGGEDAKILFLQGTLEVRMNGSCAGGTGAFIDQMATLLGVTPTEMNEEAKKAQRTYTIASRCGVFAKTDVQPLLNQGAARADVARSIFMAVVNQTIAGLAQGRPIEGSVVYLGGPLTFMSELRACFDEALHLTGSVYNEPWPAFDAELAKGDEVEIAVQIKGKVRGRITVAADASDDEMAEAAKAAVADQLEGKTVKKVIVVKGRLVNIVAI